MQYTGLPFLMGWQNFYIIIGAAAATLTGLMFVVITLLAGVEEQIATLNVAVSAFSTPTVANFCAVLLIAGVLSAPWMAYTTLSDVLLIVGIGAVIYLTTVLRHMRHVPGYHTPLRDWVWYLSVPGLAYIVLIGAAIGLPAHPAGALYTIAAAMVTLLFTGIRNAWDLVTFLAVDRGHPNNNN